MIQKKHSIYKIQSTSPSDKDNNLSDYQTVKYDYGLSGNDTYYIDKLTNSDEQNLSPRRKRYNIKRKANHIINSPLRSQNKKRKHKVIILRHSSKQLSN